MILVLLGTNPYSFSRLARAMDEYAKASGKEVFIQLGNTADFAPTTAGYERFLGKKELLEIVREAEVIVTQGGFGSVADCLLAGKRVVAVPRKPELGEAPDDQEELVRELERVGRVTGVYDIGELPSAILGAEAKAVVAGTPSRIPGLIARFIEENK